MIIDFHTHIFPEKIASTTIGMLAEKAQNKPFTDGTESGLISALKRAQADVALVLPVATKPSQFDGINRFALEINRKYVSGFPRLLSFGGIHPACEDIEEKMKFLKEQGIQGVKIHPDYQRTYIDDEGYIRIMKAARDLDMTVVTHAGIDDGYKGEPVRCPPDRILSVIKKVGLKKFVLGHYGAHSMWNEVLEKLAGKDVYFDTAYTLHDISKELFVKILDRHGEDKILFATDSPWQDIKNNAEILLSYGLGKQTEEKIFYKNALNLISL